MNDRAPAGPLKRAANLSINAELLDRARRLGINLSQTLEEHLSHVVREAEARLWLEQNKAAIDAYNERVASDGIWSDGQRAF